MQAPKIAIVKYGVGNVYSVYSGLKRAGAQPEIIEGLDGLNRYDGIVLPGVGAYLSAIKKLKEWGFEKLLDAIDGGVKVLGICLGMQLFFEESMEGGLVQGLGLLPGRIERLPVRKLPHIGWSKVYPSRKCRLLEGVKYGQYFYFVHSYAHLDSQQKFSCAYTEYEGITFTAAIEAPPLYGTQFHPERSGVAGLRVLKNFIQIIADEGTRDSL